MLQYFGAVLIFTSSLAFGLVYSIGRKKHLETLENMCRALELVHGELAARATPLPELCQLLSNRAKGKAADFFKSLSLALPRLGVEEFSQLWQEAAERELKSLSRAELWDIIALGSIVGRYELSEQLSALRSTICVLQGCKESARSAYPGEKRLGLGLSAASGVLLIVLLL